MTEDEMDQIAKDIDIVTLALADVAVLHTVTPQAAAMALALASASHVIHNGGTLADFRNLVEAAFSRAKKLHRSSSGPTMS